MLTYSLEWAKQNTSLFEAARVALCGGHLDEKDARHIFDVLADESKKTVSACVGKTFYSKHFPTDRVGPSWKPGEPIGVVDHYTAGLDARGTLMWFSKQERKPGVPSSSAHFVIERDGTIFQVINPLKNISWHARSFSYTHVGVEHVNAGLLRKTPDSFKYLITRDYPLSRRPFVQEIDGEYWEPYTIPLILSNIVLKRWLLDAFPSLKREGFIDHQMADPTRKRDCGPLWPLEDVNELVFSWKNILDSGMLWLNEERLTQAGLYSLHIEVRDFLQKL